MTELRPQPRRSSAQFAPQAGQKPELRYCANPVGDWRSFGAVLYPAAIPRLRPGAVRRSSTGRASVSEADRGDVGGRDGGRG
jgi:hypothetical protein